MMEAPIDERIIARIHADCDEELCKKLIDFMGDTHTTNGAALQAYAFALVQAIFYLCDDEQSGCSITQHYGIYMHRLLHSLWEHCSDEHAEEQKRVLSQENMVPLKKNT